MQIFVTDDISSRGPKGVTPVIWRKSAVILPEDCSYMAEERGYIFRMEIVAYLR